MDRETVFSHVVQAVANIVFRIPPNDWEVFNEDLVPSKKPPKGLGSKKSAWMKTLNEIEKQLHGMDPKYLQLDLTAKDANATFNISILETCSYIRDKIIALPAVPAKIAKLSKKVT